MKTFTITEYLRLIVVSLLILTGFLLVKPFIGTFTWGIILGVALFPLFKKFLGVFGEKHKKKGTFVFAIIIIALLIVPAFIMVTSLFSNMKETYTLIQNNELEITAPTEKVKDWPIIGERVYAGWKDLSNDSRHFAIEHKEFLLEKGSIALKSFAGVIGTIFVFVFSFIIAIMFMANAKSAFQSASDFANKLVGGDKGVDMLLIARDTVRNVVKGILFVAIIQAFLCFIGFKLMGIPGAAIFAFIAMVAGIVQIPVTLVVIPTIFIAFSISDSSLAATIFSVYIVIVSLLDNVLKPILLSKGLKTPMILIILGALGGMLLLGIIGIFIGTVLLSILHQLYITWISSKEEIVLAD
jgi:predicted PurR-regulated permease PerM